MRREEIARQIDVFGRHAHPAIVLRAEAGRDVVKIGHGAHVDPGLWYGNDDIGAAEPKTLDQLHALVGLRNAFAQQVFAGDAEMHRAARQLSGDVACRQIGDLDIVEACNGAAIIARATRLRQRETGAGEEGLGVFLQAALGRDGQNEWRGHDARSDVEVCCASVSIQTEKPTAGMGSAAPSCVSSPS